jgi:hypothetical protein
LKKPILHVVKYKTVCLQTEKRRAPPLGGASIDIGQAYTVVELCNSEERKERKKQEREEIS